MLDGCSCGVGFEGRLGDVYKEEAFHYLLTIAPSGASGRAAPSCSCWPRWGVARLDAPTTEELFATLGTCRREVDFLGWYGEGRVTGAVLTESRNRADADVPELISRRVRGALRPRLPSDVACRLQVHVYENPDVERAESSGLPARGLSQFQETI